MDPRAVMTCEIEIHVIGRADRSCGDKMDLLRSVYTQPLNPGRAKQHLWIDIWDTCTKAV